VTRITVALRCARDPEPSYGAFADLNYDGEAHTAFLAEREMLHRPQVLLLGKLKARFIHRNDAH
jgi:hypothetical protein